MKKTIIVFAVVMLFISCGDKKKTASGETTSTETKGLTVDESDDSKTANFTVDGASFAGKVSTQHFGGESGNFSVLCQQDEPFALLQAVYANEKEATGSGELKASESAYNVGTGDVNVALSGTAIGEKEFKTTSASTGTISVDGKKLILKDLKLFDSDKKEKVVSGTIAF